jgi:single-stranded-DNA-specific exonuclease
MKKDWDIKNKKLITAGSKISDIVKILLENRGFKTRKEIDSFLYPQDPYEIKPEKVGIRRTGINKAIKRIKRALADNDRIVIYGDYDADGICATAILWETLHNLGADAMPFIPSRENHGYGLSQKGIDEILSRQKDKSKNLMIITVDNGIVAYDSVVYAQNKNIDVIVSDHHQPPKKLPPALSIVWSDKIAGAGVAWFLAKEVFLAFHKTLKGFKASNSLELAAIGTITDMMPVLDVNRSLIKFGLDEIKNSHRPGILALCQDSGINQKDIDTYEVGFILGPRLNSMGRIEEAIESLRLLCTKNKNRAAILAAKLGLTNRQRQQLTQTIYEHAKNKVKDKKAKILLAAHESYNQGVVGLVAGKLAERFYKPALVLSIEGEFAKGSARSVSGFNIIDQLRNLKDLFIDLGGHPMAAGFSIKTKNIPELEKKLNALAEKKLTKDLLMPKVTADLKIGLENINWDLYNALEDFSPFGLGNPRPVFVSKNVDLISFRTVGRDQSHLKLTVKSKGLEHRNPVIFNTIGFNLGGLASQLLKADLADICYSLYKNVWNGKQNLELKLKDVKT